MHKRLHQFLLYCLLTLFLSTATAETLRNKDINQEFSDTMLTVSTTMTKIQQGLETPPITDSKLLIYRKNMISIIDKISSLSEHYKKTLKDKSILLQELEAPLTSNKDDKVGVPDDPVYAQKIKSLRNEAYGTRSNLMEVNLKIIEARTLLKNISYLRIQVRHQDLFVYNTPFYEAQSWVTGIQNFSDAGNIFVEIFPTFIENIKKTFRNTSSLFAIVVLFLLGIFYLVKSTALLQKLNHWIEHHRIDSSQKSLRIMTSFICKGILPATILYYFLNGFLSSDLSSLRVSLWAITLHALAASLAFIIIARRAVFILFNPKHQLLPELFIESRMYYNKLQTLVCVIGLIFLINGVNFFNYETIIRPIFIPSVNALINLVISFIYLYALLLLLPRMNDFIKNHATQVSKKYFKLLRVIMILTAVFYPGMIFMGAANFSIGLLLNTTQVLIIIFCTVLIKTTITAALPFLSSKTAEAVSIIATDSTDQEAKENSVAFLNYWVGFILSVVLYFIAFIFILLILGASPEKIEDWLYLVAVQGVSIGSESSFSAVYVLKAVFVLVAFYYGTRLIQRIVNHKIFPYVRLDKGSEHAISTSIGYIGLLIAIIMFVYTLGINVTTLTFIISGLSVGIGFALKDLFTNFFSGFVLLIERPIKVGDQIILGSDKGVVKKIRIRSTEVETFNRKTLIIPNSAFISRTVHNQTANPITRLVTEVGVSYDSDVRLVMRLLLEVAHEYDKVLKHPKPSVTFSNFADSAFVFELKTHVKYGTFMESDPAAGLYTEIRARIAEKFKEHDIEMPFPQRDIRLIQDTQKVIHLNVESFEESGTLPKKENSK